MNKFLVFVVIVEFDTVKLNMGNFGASGEIIHADLCKTSTLEINENKKTTIQGWADLFVVVLANQQWNVRARGKKRKLNALRDCF